jgi:hypothetical protein
MAPREQIMEALFALLTSVATFPTSGRRLMLWSNVPEQPALFLRDGPETYAARQARGQPAKVTLTAECWIYVQTRDVNAAPIVALNNLVDAVHAVLVPAAGQECQTLGGLVSHCWIEGRVEKDCGDLDGLGQAIAVIPINIMATV